MEAHNDSNHSENGMTDKSDMLTTAMAKETLMTNKEDTIHLSVTSDSNEDAALLLGDNFDEYIEQMIVEARAYNQAHFEKEFDLSHEEAKNIAQQIMAQHCEVSLESVDKETVDYAFLYELNLDTLEPQQTFLGYSALVNGQWEYVTHPLEQGVQTLLSFN